MDDVRARLERTVRAKYEKRLLREIQEAESRIQAKYDAEIEEAIQETVAEAAANAYEDKQADLEPYRLAEIADEGDGIRARYAEVIRHEVDAQLATRTNRSR